MSKRDKIKAKILARPTEIDFEELRNFLISEGWSWRPPRKGSSHHFFSKPGVKDTLTIPTVGGRKIKRVYIDDVIVALELED